jgi:hypothetical protein
MYRYGALQHYWVFALTHGAYGEKRGLLKKQYLTLKHK